MSVDRYPWVTHVASAAPDGQALDGCDVRLLARTPLSSAILCEVRAGSTSQTTINNWLHETWFVISGQGRVWRGDGAISQTVDVQAGSSLTIPPRVGFQFQSLGDSALTFLCFCAPSFPGPEANELLPDEHPLGAPTLEAGTGAGPGRSPAR